MGARRRGRPDRRHGGGRPDEDAAPSQRHGAPRREPGQRRHDPGGLRHRGRRDRGHPAADVLERLVDARALLRRRGRGRAPRGVARLARAAPGGHRGAREPRDAARPVRGVPRRRGDRRLGRARGRRGRHRGEPGRTEARPCRDPAAGPRVLVLPDVPAQRRPVRARRHRGHGGRAGARRPRTVERRRARGRGLGRAGPRALRVRGHDRWNGLARHPALRRGPARTAATGS